MNWLKYLIGISALLIAGCAAYFSVTGLGVLFAGASLSVMIMAGSLEFAKLVTATYLKQKWDEIKGFNKWYLTISVIILMIITSAGIFGYLSNAFQQQNLKLDQIEREIAVWDVKIKSNNERILSLNNQLNSLQSNQGTILERGKVNNRLLRSIDNRDKQVTKLSTQINNLQEENVTFNEEINKIRNNNIDIEKEVGGFRFVADSFNLELNTVVKFFIILIVIVFDPLAIALVIAFNQLVGGAKKEDEEDVEKEQKKVDDEPIINASDIIGEISKIRPTEEELNMLEEILLKKNETINQPPIDLTEKDLETIEETIVDSPPPSEKLIETLSEVQDKINEPINSEEEINELDPIDNYLNAIELINQLESQGNKYNVDDDEDAEVQAEFSSDEEVEIDELKIDDENQLTKIILPKDDDLEIKTEEETQLTKLVNYMKPSTEEDSEKKK